MAKRVTQLSIYQKSFKFAKLKIIKYRKKWQGPPRQTYVNLAAGLQNKLCPAEQFWAETSS